MLQDHSENLWTIDGVGPRPVKAEYICKLCGMLPIRQMLGFQSMIWNVEWGPRTSYQYMGIPQPHSTLPQKVPGQEQRHEVTMCVLHSMCFRHAHTYADLVHHVQALKIPMYPTWTVQPFLISMLPCLLYLCQCVGICLIKLGKHLSFALFTYALETQCHLGNAQSPIEDIISNPKYSRYEILS